MADAALRVLAIGYVDNGHIDGLLGFPAFQGKVILIGLVGQLDPPREEVANSVRECRRAGIRPVMLTGDHKATGLAIARALGISRQGDLAFDGQELDSLSDLELAEKIDHISIFGRVHPEQKLRIVRALQKKRQCRCDDWGWCQRCTGIGLRGCRGSDGHHRYGSRKRSRENCYHR